MPLDQIKWNNGKGSDDLSSYGLSVLRTLLGLFDEGELTELQKGILNFAARRNLQGIENR